MTASTSQVELERNTHALDAGQSLIARVSLLMSTGLGEVMLAALVFLAALLIRWPYLQQIPRFNDEVTIWRTVLGVVNGGARPLVFEDTGYNGPLVIYLLALARLISSALEMPRILTVLLGSAAVVAVYLFGRALYGRLAGVIGAALFGVTLTPVVTYSHVLHMGVLAIVLQVLGWWAAVRAGSSGRAAWLIAAAALTGLAVQTHPLCAVFVPGLVIWLWRQSKGRRLLWSRWGVLALLTLFLAYTPVILYHLPALLGGSRSRVVGASSNVAGEWGAVPYPTGIVNLALSFVDVLSSARHGPGFPWLADGFALLVAAAAVASLIYTARRQSLPLWLVGSALVCMPLLVREYNNTLLGRYSGLALPAIQVAIGGAVAMLLLGSAGRRGWWPTAGRAAVAVLVVVMLAGLTMRLAGYYAVEQAAGRTNDEFFAVVADVEQQGQPVVLDSAIKRTSGEGTGPSSVLDGMLAWRGVEVKRLGTAEKVDNYLRAISWPAQVIVSDATLEQMATRSKLGAAQVRDIAPLSDVNAWGLYQFTP
ncbi:MAG: glycosyltransferase family 39 protein [Anaerolineae bacterium]